MAIRMTCPSCGKPGRVPDAALGKTIRCPSCSHRIVLSADTPTPDGPKPLAEAPVSVVANDPYQLTLDPGDLTIRTKTSAASREIRPGRRGGQAPILAGAAIGLVLLLGVTAKVVIGLSGSDGPVVQPKVVFHPRTDADRVEHVERNVPAAASAPSAANPPKPELDAIEQVPPPPPAATVSAEMTDDGDVPNVSLESDVAASARAGAADVASRDEAAGRPLSTADIVAESEPSVALIKGKVSSGTGFLVGPGLLATNAHVIAEEFISDLEIRFVSADENHKAPLKPELLYLDAARDLAFLAVRTDLKPLRVAKAYTFRKGEDVTVIGNPGMGDGKVLENAISRGIMSTKARIEDQDFYQLGIAINPGNSGGPVFDSSGRVIGVATLKSAKQEAMGFSIPIEDLQAALAKLVKETTADAARARSRHRINNAVKGLGSGGALMCLTIDVRRASATTNDAEVKELLEKLEAAAAELDKDVFPSLSAQAPRINKDAMVSRAVKEKVHEMAENFARIRDIYARRGDVGDDQLRAVKQTHKRLITELSDALKIKFPEGMMVAFDDHAPTQPQIIMADPQGFGFFGPQLRPRFGMGVQTPLMPSPLIPGQPGFHPQFGTGIIPPMMPGQPDFRNRMGPRRGFP